MHGNGQTGTDLMLSFQREKEEDIIQTALKVSVKTT